MLDAMFELRFRDTVQVQTQCYFHELLQTNKYIFRMNPENDIIEKTIPEKKYISGLIMKTSLNVFVRPLRK